MESEWRVASNSIDDHILYGVYRLRDKDDIDHSGNREYYGGYVKSEEQAQKTAEDLNMDDLTEVG